MYALKFHPAADKATYFFSKDIADLTGRLLDAANRGPAPQDWQLLKTADKAHATEERLRNPNSCYKFFLICAAADFLNYKRRYLTAQEFANDIVNKFCQSEKKVLFTNI